MQYKITNGAVYYDSDMVLENIDIEINDGEKIAIVGRNGCGKTTLLKAIMGEVEMEEGTGESEFRVSKVGAPEISYLRQMPFENEYTPMGEEVRKVFRHLTDMEEEMKMLVDKMEKTSDEKTIAAFTALNDRYIALGGMTYQKEYKTVIRRFGFSEEDEQKPVAEFSGGQRTKIAFIKMLLTKPDILLLDEPTNHLDIRTVEWLEGYLKSYRSTLVIVSHDRLFLDRIVDKVYEIEWGETRLYRGNYADFEQQKKVNYYKQLKDYEHQQAEIARLNRLIERFRYKATKAKMVQSKIKLLEHMKLIAAPDRADTGTFRARFQPELPSSRVVLDVKDMVIGYDRPLATINLHLERGQKLGIIGGNGIGKSTFLKTLMKKVEPLSGRFQFGYNTDIAYFDQQLAQISGEQTIFDIFSNAYPKLNDSEVRSALGAFRFTGEEVFRTASTLSGGEKVRLTLCKLLYSHPNVLILDEPTNHMDIIGKQTLEDILTEYEGTVIFVSHDRYFVKKIADRLLVFENGTVSYVDSDYDVYEQKRLAAMVTEEEPTPKEQPKEKKVRYMSPKKEIDKKKKRIERLELLMQECQNEIAEVDRQIASPEVYSDYQKLTELQAESDAVRQKSDEYEEEWTTLMLELEELEAEAE
jgi:ATP-binding cassette subfamily F protein 3